MKGRQHASLVKKTQACHVSSLNPITEYFSLPVSRSSLFLSPCSHSR